MENKQPEKPENRGHFQKGNEDGRAGRLKGSTTRFSAARSASRARTRTASEIKRRGIDVNRMLGDLAKPVQQIEAHVARAGVPSTQSEPHQASVSNRMSESLKLDQTEPATATATATPTSNEATIATR